MGVKGPVKIIADFLTLDIALVYVYFDFLESEIIERLLKDLHRKENEFRFLHGK